MEPARTPLAHPGLYAVIAGLSAIIIVGALWAFWPHPSERPTPTPTASITSTPMASVSVQTLPLDFTISPTTSWEEDPVEPKPDPFLVTLIYKDTRTDGTNFRGASLRIAKSTSTEPSLCLANIRTSELLTETHATSVGNWYVLRESDAFAGSRYDNVSYNLLRGTTCYTVQVTVHTVNRQNLADPESLREFDPAVVFASAETVLATFRFTE